MPGGARKTGWVIGDHYDIIHPYLEEGRKAIIGSSWSCASESNVKPNILLICLDAAYADRFSCYGYTRPTTPRIGALSVEGTVFERAVATSCWTVPTHASCFTGLYPSEHGAFDRVLSEGTGPTLAEWLQAQGYATVLVSANGFIGERYGFSRGFDFVREVWRDAPRLRSGHVFGWTKRKLGIADKGATNILRYLVNLGLAKRQPFFAFINYMETHAPYVRSLPGFTRLPGPSRYFLLAAAMSRLHKERRFLAPTGERGRKQLAALSALYDEHLAFADHHLRRLGSRRGLCVRDRATR